MVQGDNHDANLSSSSTMRKSTFAAILSVNVLFWVALTAATIPSEVTTSFFGGANSKGSNLVFQESNEMVETGVVAHRKLSVESGITDPKHPSMSEYVDAFDEIGPKFKSRDNIHEYLEKRGMDRYESLIYFVTPTYKHTTQMLDLIRLFQTLMLDKRIYWIVVEDSKHCTRRVRNILVRSGMLYAHLAHPTDYNEYLKYGHRGIAQRNHALDFVDSLKTPGVVYFGDASNAYDIRLFDEIQNTESVGVLSVGFTGNGAYQRCLVDEKTGLVTNFATSSLRTSKYVMPLSAFTFHTLALEAKGNPRFLLDLTPEDTASNFVDALVDDASDLEPLGDNCMRVFVWHVSTGGVLSADPLTDPIAKYVSQLV